MNNRHSGFANMWFWDGHAAKVSPGEFKEKIGGIFGSPKSVYYVKENLTYASVN